MIGKEQTINSTEKKGARRVEERLAIKRLFYMFLIVSIPFLVVNSLKLWRESNHQALDASRMQMTTRALPPLQQTATVVARQIEELKKPKPQTQIAQAVKDRSPLSNPLSAVSLICAVILVSVFFFRRNKKDED